MSHNLNQWENWISADLTLTVVASEMLWSVIDVVWLFSLELHLILTFSRHNHAIPVDRVIHLWCSSRAMKQRSLYFATVIWFHVAHPSRKPLTSSLSFFSSLVWNTHVDLWIFFDFLSLRFIRFPVGRRPHHQLTKLLECLNFKLANGCVSVWLYLTWLGCMILIFFLFFYIDPSVYG